MPVIPGVDPRITYGNLAERSVKGIVLEAFGVGNMPDLPKYGWLPWLKTNLKEVTQSSACTTEELMCKPQITRGVGGEPERAVDTRRE